MFCPHCGTRMVAADQQFCRECGREIPRVEASQGPASEARAQQTAQSCPWSSWAGGPMRWPSARYGRYGMTRRGPFHPLLLVLGALLLLPLAIPLLAVTLLAGFAVVGLAFKLAPIVLIGLGIYWLVNRQRPVIRV